MNLMMIYSSTNIILDPKNMGIDTNFIILSSLVTQISGILVFLVMALKMAAMANTEHFQVGSMAENVVVVAC